MSKRIKIGFSLACMLLTMSCFAVSMPKPSSTVQPLDKVVAIVNSDVVTQSQLAQAMKRARVRLRQAHMTIPPKVNFKKTVLQQLINRSLQLQVAKRIGIQVSNQQLNQFISRLAKQRGLSVAQWQKNQIQQSGYTLTTLRAALKDQLRINQVQSISVAKNIKLSDQDLAKVKAKIIAMQQQGLQYHVVDYLVALPDSPTATQMQQAQRKAKQLRAQLSSGGNVVLSKSVSKNNMGWVQANQLPTLFLNAIQGKSSGFTSGPLVAGNGIHIIKLLAKQGQLATSPSAQQVRAYAMQQQFMIGLEKWVKTLRKSAFIKINLS